MDTIRLMNKETGKINDYDIRLSNIPQTVEIECEGVARGYNSLADIADKYEIIKEDK